jgi:hypothetical protein
MRSWDGFSDYATQINHHHAPQGQTKGLRKKGGPPTDEKVFIKRIDYSSHFFVMLLNQSLTWPYPEPYLRTPNPGFNPGFTPPFMLQMLGVNPWLIPWFGVL